jgi:hypothetical protein
MNLREKIAEALMIAHGYKKNTPILKHEWDPEKEDSAYSMMLEDADIALEVLEKHDEDDVAPLLGVVQPPEEAGEAPSDSVQIKTVYFLSLKNEAGKPIFLSDVKSWVEEAVSANIPEDTEVEGSLHLMHDFNSQQVDAIYCPQCKDEGTLLVRNHECK